jgi:protein-disulfide isomerase
VGETDHIKGNTQSAIVLVEYGDFQCPACRSYTPIITQLEQNYGDRIAFVFRHFPLPVHANSKNAARASEAAAIQGKFWEMHDILFDKQDDWAKKGDPEDIFMEYAVSLGLNPDQFREDFNSDGLKDKVQKDLLAANAEGLNSTPSFFLNGIKVRNPQSYGEFEQLITAVLAEQGGGQQPDVEQSAESGDSEQPANEPIEEGADSSSQEGS